MGFSFKKLGKAFKKAAASVDVTSKKSAIRQNAVKLDKVVGGKEGWGKIAVVAGTVVAATGVGVLAGGAIASAGKGLAAKGAADKVNATRQRQISALEQQYLAEEAKKPANIIASSFTTPSLNNPKSLVAWGALGAVVLGVIWWIRK